jgi:hypothetical protein
MLIIIKNFRRLFVDKKYALMYIIDKIIKNNKIFLTYEKSLIRIFEKHEHINIKIKNYS